MRDQASWTVSLGRWGSVEVRVHLFFFLFAVFTLYLGWTMEQVEMAAMSLGVLAFSVLLHELGHQTVAQRVGIDLDPIVLGPFGGLETPPERYPPRAELSVFVAGPLTNLCVAAIVAGVLFFSQGFDSVVQRLHPLNPENLVVTGEKWGSLLALTLWINWVLFLINLLPVFPFDGGRALRAGLTICWPDISRESAIGIVSGLAKVVAFGLLVLTWISWSDEQVGTEVPNWLALLLLAIFLFFSAKQEQQRLEDEKALFTSPLLDDVFDDDDDDLGYLEEDQEEAFVDWLEQRRDVERNRQREIEEEEEQLVDEILRQVHERGFESLTDEERSLLHRVSARYRNRRRV